ncbi:MAG TPA: adenylate/guanylate cyclase domain-containing protein, partial [Candidatus Limnocylindrales bacterium]|nr:adenylate/guanylate cyclase domain-containing protein [Candidatus Limnocylindrales bacterium]
MACPSCAAPLPAGAKFCPECGTRIAPATRTIRHERRLLTVLFADLVGFTAASDQADPEDVRARVRPFHALVRTAVGATGGVVARVVGDGVMAVWGYPIAREDDARRAIEAALRIRDGLPTAGDDLHARIGVNTGEAVVAFGSEEEDADDAMGDAVNVAARLASNAAPDSILVGSVTRALAADAMVFEDLEPIRVKGKAEAVPVARVVGRATAPGPQESSAFVGRVAEVDSLVDGLRSVASEGGLRRVLVVGEPGIGKSRLIGE